MERTDKLRLHEQALERLTALVKMRSQLLRRLHAAAEVAANITPAVGMVVEYDTSSARALLDEIDAMARSVAAGVDDVNRCAAEIGKPPIRWQKFYFDD